MLRRVLEGDVVDGERHPDTIVAKSWQLQLSGSESEDEDDESAAAASGTQLLLHAMLERAMWTSYLA